MLLSTVILWETTQLMADFRYAARIGEMWVGQIWAGLFQPTLQNSQCLPGETWHGISVGL